MADKPFSEMTPQERRAWVSGEVKGGKINPDQGLSLVDRVKSALQENGPMTAMELGGALNYSNYKSLTSWANKNRSKLDEAGIIRHISPDDGRTRIWFLKSHVERDDEEPTTEQSINRAGSGILGRLSSPVAPE